MTQMCHIYGQRYMDIIRQNRAVSTADTASEDQSFDRGLQVTRETRSYVPRLLSL